MHINELKEMFDSYRALAHTSTLMPNQFEHKTGKLCTTLMTPNGLGIDTYTQYHKTYSINSRRGRPAREIIFIFECDQSTGILDCYPNGYYARSSENDMDSRERTWSAGIGRFPESLQEIYQDNYKLKKSSYITTTNESIKSKTNLELLQEIAKVVHEERKTADFDDLTIGFSEVQISKQNLQPKCILVNNNCKQTLVLAFLSTTLLNYKNGQTIQQALTNPTIPVVVPDDDTIKHYDFDQVRHDLLENTQLKSINIGRWQKDLKLIENEYSEVYSQIIYEIVQQCSADNSETHKMPEMKQSSTSTVNYCYPEQRRQLPTEQLIIRIKLDFNFISNNIVINHFSLMELVSITKAILQFSTGISLLKNILSTVLQLEHDSRSRFINTLIQPNCSLHNVIQNSHLPYCSAFLIKHFEDIPFESCTLINEKNAQLYSSHQVFQQVYCLRLLSCYDRFYWKPFIQQLQTKINHNDINGYKQLVCRKLIAQSSVNRKTLFLYTALGLQYNLTAALENDSIHSNAVDSILALNVAKQIAQTFLDWQTTPSNNSRLSCTLP